MGERRISILHVLPIAIATAILLVIFLPGLFREDPQGLPSMREGQPAPALTLTQLGAQTPFPREVLEAPGVKLVNFWASWCGPCRAEHPNLELLAREGVPIYGINYKDAPDDALRFLEELGDPYAGIGADTTGRTALDWGVFGIPETFVIDGEGRVILRFAGPITQRTLESHIRPALAEAGTGS